MIQSPVTVCVCVCLCLCKNGISPIAVSFSNKIFAATSVFDRLNSFQYKQI